MVTQHSTNWVSSLWHMSFLFSWLQSTVLIHIESPYRMCCFANFVKLWCRFMFQYSSTCIFCIMCCPLVLMTLVSQWCVDDVGWMSCITSWLCSYDSHAVKFGRWKTYPCSGSTFIFVVYVIAWVKSTWIWYETVCKHFWGSWLVCHTRSKLIINKN